MSDYDTDILSDSIALPSTWFDYVVTSGVSEAIPGIYEWHIEGVGSYIGQYGRIRRPTKKYGRNVTRILNDRAYRASKPNGFRRIHRELACAHKAGARITLVILENVASPMERNRRERDLIALRGTLNGPLA